MSNEELIILGLCTIVGLNLYATFRVLISDSFERSQKLTQTILIWILPVFGAMVMLYFSGGEDDDFGASSSNRGGHDSSPPGGYDNGGSAD